MRQPCDVGFDQTLEDWWSEINDRVTLVVDLYAGGQDPMLDWLRQPDSDRVWYYAIDDWCEDDFRNRFWLAEHLPEIESVHVTTALFITHQIDPDIAESQEIPGVWLVRCQKH